MSFDGPNVSHAKASLSLLRSNRLRFYHTKALLFVEKMVDMSRVVPRVYAFLTPQGSSFSRKKIVGVSCVAMAGLVTSIAVVKMTRWGLGRLMERPVSVPDEPRCKAVGDILQATPAERT